MSNQTDFKNKSQEQMIEYAVRMRKRAEAAEASLAKVRAVALEQPCLADSEDYCDVRASLLVVLGIEGYVHPPVDRRPA